MKTNPTDQPGGRAKWPLVVAVIMLGCGLLIGFVVGFKILQGRGPSAVRIFEGLSAPLPVPNGATLLKSEREGYGLYFGKGRERIEWSRRLLLDVTNLTQTQIEDEVCKLYQAWFDNVTNAPRSFWRGVDCLPGGVMISGALSYQKFSFGSFGWTWNRRYRHDTEHFRCEIHMELMDFDEIRPGTDFPQRYSVEGPGSEVRRQRVMHIILSLEGRDLSDIDRVSDMTIKNE